MLGGDTSARAEFIAALESALAADPGHVAVIRINLDRFVRIRQMFGVEVANEVHEVLDDRIQRAVGANQAVLRYGEDCYAAVTRVDGTDDESLENTAMDIMERVSAPIDVGGLRIAVGSNVGLAAAAHFEVADPHRMINGADIAVQRADIIGARRVIIYEVSRQGDPTRMPELYRDMLGALERREFVPTYQPIVSLPGCALFGVEVLMRWHHDEHGLLPPGDFLEEAERSGLVRVMDAQVRRTAMEACATWQKTFPVAISINLSAIDLDAASLVTDVDEILSTTGLDPKQVIFEITETALAQHWSRSLRRIEALKELGVRLAIDDFGSGHMYLERLSSELFDVIKIDRSLVVHEDAKGRGEAMLSAITAMAHRLGLSVTAEGIETPEQLDRVIAAGCDHAQGFLFGRAVGEDELVKAVARAAAS